MDLNQIVVNKIAPTITRAEARLKADKVVRRTVKGIVKKREILPENDGFHVIVEIGKNGWRHTFKDVDVFCGFLDVGEIVAVTIDEYRNKSGEPFYRDVLDMRHLDFS